MVLRDYGINAFVAGVANEVGIEPTVRHAADLGYILMIATAACGAGNDMAAFIRSHVYKPEYKKLV